MEVDEAVARVREALCEKDLLPKYRGQPFPTGHCYVACEAVAQLVPGLRPASMRVGQEVHWVLMDPDGQVVDPTADQFASPLDYATLRRRGFLTKNPSKRTQRVLARVIGGTHGS